MKRILVYSICVLLMAASCGKRELESSALPERFSISTEALKDKIRGGWAGQTIGCTFGGPTEFKFKGTLIQDYQPIIWHDHYIKETFEIDPGLYDDVYIDMTFVEILEKYGLNAPVDSFALSFARDDYKLWHANQAARYNILNGIMPPASGHWLNNPHADDIDFQIEADFAGMMTPGMINASSIICDSIGHIMNYGDGFYGGAFMSAMYSAAYVTDDIELVVSEALKIIPPESKFYKTIADVIAWHKQYPDDWKKAWFEIEKNHSSDKGCSEGVFNAFNIDASLNAAYVVMGLLYGEKDFFKTMDVATRCGQDSDCNPATAAGILGVMIGYKNIPKYWKPALEEAEDLKFPYMDISLRQIYDLSFKHALAVVRANGGTISDSLIAINVQKPQVLKLEQSFEGLYPASELLIRKDHLEDPIVVDFTGNGVVVLGNLRSICGVSQSDYVALLDVYVDGKNTGQMKMPFDYIVRKYDIYHNYSLPQGKHKIEIKWTNPNSDFRMYLKSVVTYGDSPVKSIDPVVANEK